MAISMTGGRERRRHDLALYVPWIGPLLTESETTPTGGAETSMYLLARALARSGAKVKLLVFPLPEGDLPTTVEGIDVVVRPPYRSQMRFGKVREVVAIARAVLRANARVVVTCAAGPHVGIVALFAKLSRRRFVYSSMNISDFDFGRLEPKRHNRALYRLGIRLADEIVVQTEEQALMCKEQFRRASRQIGSIAEPAEQRRSAPEAFLWANRLVWYKRPLAYVELAQAVPEAQFWMIPVPVDFWAGGPALMEELRQRASDTPNLRILEPRRRPDLMRLIERTVAMVNTADFEGMPNLLLESWARGVPALALSHDPDGVIERHALGGFAAGSMTKLTELAAHLWESRTDQTEISARCRKYVDEHHSPTVVASAWMDILDPRPVRTTD